MKRSTGSGGEITYKICPHTKSFTYIWTYLFVIKWAKQRSLDQLQVLTYDYKEKRSRDSDSGHVTVSDLYLVGFRMKDGAERTLFRFPDQQHSCDLVGQLKRDLGKPIGRRNHIQSLSSVTHEKTERAPVGTRSVMSLHPIQSTVTLPVAAHSTPRQRSFWYEAFCFESMP
ncbi:MAG: hypothetical protein GY917_18475 [Planctomycetaceae bacterium]|nr:hypothetical protein [Planctomycetaceae bacterium]